MLRYSEEELLEMDAGYPGVLEQILSYEALVLPACTACGSEDTAKSLCGLIGRTMTISAATTKAKLIPYKTDFTRDYFCNECKEFFDDGSAEGPGDEAE